MAATRKDQDDLIEIGAASAITAGPAGPLIEFILTFALPGMDRA
jgi:hypothetical protein